MRFAILAFAILITPSLYAASLNEAYKAWKQKDFKKAETILEQLQVESPYDNKINYNLGNVQYRLGKYLNAKESFKRVGEGFSAYKKKFNLGNSCYKNSLSILGDAWEKKELEQAVLDNAIKEVKEAIEVYGSTKSLELSEEERKRVKVNRKYAEDLLKKLEKKKQQQDKKNQQKKDKEKQDKDKEDQQKQDQDKKDQNEDKRDSDQEKQQDQDKQDQEKQDSDQQKDQQNPQDQKQEQQKQGEGRQDEQEDQVKQEQKEMAAGKEEQADMEEKGMRALLDKLQSDEQKLQKALIRQQVAGSMKERQRGQKNW